MAALFNWERDNSGSLFERIQGVSVSSPPEDSAGQAATLIRSLKNSLGNLLNARPGWSQCAGGLGVIDLNDASPAHGALDLHGNLREAIRECIRRFEPRIGEVWVEALPHPEDPLSLCFHVTVQVPLPDEQQVMEFNIQLNSHKSYLFE